MITAYVLEDQDGLREDTLFALNAQGVRASGAASGNEFAALCAKGLPDVAVIDRMLPDADGLLIARRLRNSWGTKNVGIVFLTSMGALDQKLEGLELGDAYLVKPVDMRELAAVIRSVHRCLHSASQDGTACNWRLVPRRLELVSPSGKIIELSLRELQILVVLATANGKWVAVRKLVEAMDEDWMVYEKNRLELLFSRLRQKVRATNELSINMIKSVRNEGYQLTIPLVLDDT